MSTFFSDLVYDTPPLRLYFLFGDPIRDISRDTLRIIDSGGGDDNDPTTSMVSCLFVCSFVRPSVRPFVCLFVCFKVL